MFETFEPRRLMAAAPAAARAAAEAAATATAVPLAAGKPLASSGVKDISGDVYAAIRDNDVPAGAAGTIEDGALTSLGASGRRMAGKKFRVTTDDRWHLGSSGKAMTSTMVARLIERGVVDWDTTVLDLYPKLDGKITGDFGDVTIWQLMTHRSGISDVNVVGSLAKLGTLDGDRMEQRQDMVPILLKTDSSGVGDYSYSNWAYALLGAMAERATGESFENLMRKYVFGPLKMDSAGFGAQGRDGGKVLYQPRGHTSSGKPRTAAHDDLLPYLAPAGLMSMSVVDWGKFLKAHMGLKVGKVQLLKASTLDRLHTPYDGSGTKYAAGWYVTDVGGNRVLSHDGTNGTWYSTVQLIPERKFAAFSVVNQGGSNGFAAAYAIKNKLLDEALPDLGDDVDFGDIDIGDIIDDIFG